MKLIPLFCLFFSFASFAVLKKTGKSIDADSAKLPKINPVISANFLMLYDYSQLKKENNGFKIQEVLLQFGASVDDLFEAEIFIGIEQLEDREGFEVSPIGVFGETQRIENMNFRIGQFLNHFGEHNSRYKHNFPFIVAPLINQELFGERGLNFIGIGTDWLSLFHDTSEITFEITQGKNHNLFNDDKNHYLGTVRYIAHYELEDGHNLKVGGTGGVGEIKQWLWGADFSYDYVIRPDHNFQFRFEYMGKNKNSRQGLYTQLAYRFLTNWKISYRYDHTGLEKNRIEPIARKNSIMIAALPTYFSGVRLEYSHLTKGDGTKDNRIMFQVNQTVGPRRAHSY